MFIKLNHQNLEVYAASKLLTIECYKFTNQLPAHEKFALISQIRRAALSIHLNIAEGSSRSSKIERRRYFEIARGSIIEIDAALDIAKELGYFETFQGEILGRAILHCFKLISGMINSIPKSI